MRWNPGQRSSDLDDRRAQGGGGGGARLGVGGLLLLLVLSVVFKRDFFSLVGAGGGGDGSAGPVDSASLTAEEPMVQFVSAVLDSAQTAWTAIFTEHGKEYRHARLALFRDASPSACGTAQSATGPFYCPGDQEVYIDLGFFDELKQRFGAPGDFAQAYVLAHEIGHHVQFLLGTEQRVRRAQEARPEQANQLSVRLELQADCYAGVWANHDRGMIEPGDIDEGLAAAAAVGDDRLQRMAGRAVNPDGFTHGSSAQRMTWFRRGFEGGRLEDCDTFR
jgi:uncharacterized protein